MNLDTALQAFIIESRDLLEGMEQALLQIERDPDDAETINAIFRAAHTIKGSAGIFGLDAIVAFTHVAESVLDQARGGRIRFGGELANLFLGVCDHIRALVDQVADGPGGSDVAAASGDALVTRMQAVLAGAPAGVGGTGTGAVASDKAPAVPAGAVAEPSGCAGRADHWHLSLRFGADTMRSGFDPLSFIRYLTTLGTIAHIVTLSDAVPPLGALEPDACHLGFELALCSHADKATIEGAFDFVRDDSQIRILPPRSKVSEYMSLIRAQTEDLRLGEILVRCGTLTRAELDAAIDEQTAAQCTGQAAQPLGEVLVARQQVHPEVLHAALAQQTQIRSSRVSEAASLRVDASKLDHLIDLVGELIIAGAGAHLIARQHKIKDLAQATSGVTRLMEQVRDTALGLRMVPIGGTFQRFERVVRDVSRELGKDIGLEISGAQTELDKGVVEKLADPLTHLVRNAIDHGIEDGAQRARAGKPARGTLRLHARHEAGQVVVEVGDDGGGLSRQRILAKAIERGLTTDGAALSDEEVFDFIFQPGFSTAEQVSNLSGRGVGMDVVRRSIAALRGTVTLRSRVGEGTTVSIRLPLTLAIIDGFLMAVGKAAYVVPLGAVSECVELARRDTEGRDWLDLRGEVLPLVRLRELYGVEGEPGRRQNVVVVQRAGQRVGLVVDQLMGELQTVIKPLGRVFQQVRGIAGFTILGNGSVALLLDIPSLVLQAVQESDQRWSGPEGAPAASPLAFMPGRRPTPSPY